MRKLRPIFFLISLALTLSISIEPASGFGRKDKLEDALEKVCDELKSSLTSNSKIKRIGISEFTPTAGAAIKLGPYLSDKMTAIMVQGGSLDIIERAKLDLLIDEIALSQSGLVEEGAAQKVGKILGVEAFIMGSYTRFPKKVEITARLVETETGKILATSTAPIKISDKIQPLMEPLVSDVPLQLEGAVLAQRKTDKGWDAIMVEEGGTLYSNDNIKIFFRTNEDCYVYVLMFDSSGKASQIFPNKDISMSNRIEGKREYRIPPGGDWFWLDDKIGTETVYVIASYEPLKEITRLLMEMEKEGEKGRLEASKELENKITTRGIGGVRPGANIKYTTTDGKIIEKVTKTVEGKVSAVRKISFKHK